MSLRHAICVGVALAGLRLLGGGCGPAIEAALQPIIEKHGVPALAAAVVTGEGLEACGAAGVRKRGNDSPAKADDLWHLGSDTKAMTATLVGVLVEQGVLAWDTRVAEVLPELAASLHSDCKDVTVRQLLAHRGGLRKDLNWGAIRKAGGSVMEQRLRAVREGLSEKPESPCGTRTLYSNLGYVIVGAVIERKTGRTWEEVVTEQVFKPLGMTRVGFGGTGTPGQLDQPWGHTDTGQPVAKNGPDMDNPQVLGPAGRVHCTLQDWARFVADQLRGAQGHDGLLKAATYRVLHEPAAGGELALGWAVAERPWGGGTVLTHNGCNTMNFSVAWLAPKRDFAVLVCCNRGGLDADKACDAAAAALIGIRQRAEAKRLDACAEHAWRVTWERFYLPSTHLLYDYLTSYEPGRGLAHLPTADEVARQIPNECGYGSGMEDGMISAGVMLDLLVDRYAVTKQDDLREQARAIVEGVRLCATAHGVTGFLARAVCHEDVTRVYPNSSRDQYTHAVHGLWRYVHSPLCSDQAKAEVGLILSAIADRMTRNVTPENDYDSLRLDGSRDTRGISRMWNVKGHEAARLPMLYAAAWDVTGRREYYDLYRKYVGSAVEQSLTGDDKQPTYALLQMQDSMELLESLETDAGLKRQMREVMAMVSKRCALRAANADKAAQALDLTMLCTDWRTGEGVRTGGAYRKVWYNIRESGEAALTQLMDSGSAYPAEQQALLARALTRLDYDKVSSGGVFYLQAAYWKARRRGLLGE
jgi:CubicO group peptidase (beta-lactamase class C family)